MYPVRSIPPTSMNDTVGTLLCIMCFQGRNITRNSDCIDVSLFSKGTETTVVAMDVCANIKKHIGVNFFIGCLICRVRNNDKAHCI